MAEPIRLLSPPAAAAPARRRAPLYADFLPDQPIATEPDRHSLRWILRELARLAFIAAVVSAAICFLWSRH